MSRLDELFGPEVCSAIREEIRATVEADTDNRRLLTVSEFAAVSGLNVKSVRNHVDRKQLQTVRLGGRVLIPLFEARRVAA